jgi:uncharacterized protein YbjT (DUF2867 family)
MFVLLGSHGQITSRLARRLLAAGKRVRVVGRNAAALAPLAQAGAEVAVGNAGDAAFLARAFEGARGAYVMTPPGYAEPDMRDAQDRVGTAIARALADVRVPRVVNLSSVGAELPSGTGPIAGLHAQERRLDAVAGLDLLHLRPGYFMENLLHAIPVVAQAGVLPGMEPGDVPLPMVATADIAAVAERELVRPVHRGVLVLHAPAHPTLTQATRAFAAAIGRPGIAYVQADPAQAKAAMRAQGFSASAADEMEALARWLGGASTSSLAGLPADVQPTTIEAFARETFAPAYAAHVEQMRQSA